MMNEFGIKIRRGLVILHLVISGIVICRKIEVVHIVVVVIVVVVIVPLVVVDVTNNVGSQSNG